MTDLTRRGFLKGATLAGAAVALGRIPAVPSAAPVVAASLPIVAAPTITKLATWIPVTTEMLEDGMAFQSIVHDSLAHELARSDEWELVG